MNGIDCATKLTAASAHALKQTGVEAVGRYLGRTLWNGLTLDEAKAIHDAGLALFLIWELSPTKASYFSYAKGVSDAQQAIAETEYLGAPKGVAIYFTVDYDAQAGDMTAIGEYFHGVQTVLTGKYLVGAYGSYSVMEALKGASFPPDRFFQTYAWSYGYQTANHIYQHSNDGMVAGVACDQDYVNEDAGLWIKQGGGEVQMDKVVVYFTAKDYSVAMDIADLHGGCAMFCRNGGANVHPDAKKALTVYNVGGPALGWANEVYTSGNSALDTVVEVAKAYTEGKLA